MTAEALGRENAETKARRYLTEGRLIVRAINGAHVTAIARGNGAIHRINHHPGTGWDCTCPARSRCCHLIAAQLVTAPQEAPR